MKIMVAVKRVVDAYVAIRIKNDGSGVELANTKMAMNPFCEIAVEEAVRLKEAGLAESIHVVSVGDDACCETLRQALALGADCATLVETSEPLQPLAVAKCLKALVEREKPDLVILGKQSIDGDNNQTGQMLAGLLGWAQGTFVSKLTLTDGQAIVVREVDGGLETLQLTLPAVITTDLRLNEPRYAALPNIMKAKQKPLTKVPIVELKVESDARQTLMQISAPEPRSKGQRVNSVAELVAKLHNEAKVI